MVRNNVIKTLTPALALTGWQYSEQYLSPFYGKQTIDLSNNISLSVDQLLPFADAILLGTLAWIVATSWDDTDKSQHHNTSPTHGKAYVGWNVLLSLTCAALAYVLTEEFFPENTAWTTWPSAIAVGTGFALPGLITNAVIYSSDKDLNTPKNIAISTACAFGGGLSWYMANKLPELLGSNDIVMKGIVSPAVTLLAAALLFGIACWADRKEIKVSNNTNTNTNDTINNFINPKPGNRKFGN